LPYVVDRLVLAKADLFVLVGTTLFSIDADKFLRGPLAIEIAGFVRSESRPPFTEYSENLAMIEKG
jgi:hypothetical protein